MPDFGRLDMAGGRSPTIGFNGINYYNEIYIVRRNLLNGGWIYVQKVRYQRSQSAKKADYMSINSGARL